MELFETIWPALLVVLAAGVAFGWSKLKKLVAETPTKIDDDLVRMVEEVLAQRSTDGAKARAQRRAENEELARLAPISYDDKFETMREKKDAE